MFTLAIMFKKVLTIFIYLIFKLNRAIKVTISFYIIFLYTLANIYL